MDLLESSNLILKEQFEYLESHQNEKPDSDPLELPEGESQTFSEGYFCDQDNNLSKILNQQAYLKRIIDEDNAIQIARNKIARSNIEIEQLRAANTRENEEALKKRQELAEAQAKELEKFQMNQIKSIADDYSRHHDILAHRKKEIQSLNKEIEQEQKGRDAFLADKEQKLERQLQERARSFRGGTLPFQPSNRAETNNTDPTSDPKRIELTSVDEYAPYGTAPHSRMSTSTSTRGARARGRSRGRGRKRN